MTNETTPMTSHIARAREARKPRVRSEAHKEQQRAYHRERRRKQREAAGAMDRTQWIAFVAAQAAKAKPVVVIQPSIAKRQTMQAANNPGETVEQFLARGGRVDVLPGFAPKPGPMPARHYVGTGSRTP